MERKCLDCCSEHIFFQVLRQLFRWLHNMHKWANGKDEAFTTVYTNLCTPVLAFLFPICCVKLCLSGCFSGGWKKWKMLSNWRISSGLSWTVRAHHIQGRKTLPKQFIWSLTEEATQPSGGVASPQHWLWMIAVEASLTPRFLLIHSRFLKDYLLLLGEVPLKRLCGKLFRKPEKMPPGMSPTIWHLPSAAAGCPW